MAITDQPITEAIIEVGARLLQRHFNMTVDQETVIIGEWEKKENPMLLITKHGILKKLLLYCTYRISPTTLRSRSPDDEAICRSQDTYEQLS